MALPTKAELESAVLVLGEELLDNERMSFTFAEAEALADALGYSTATPVIRALKTIGFAMDERKPERRVRTVSSNPHDRWHGPGSSPTYGGSGWEQINGFAGDEG
jgi:hypothetical protein